MVVDPAATPVTTPVSALHCSHCSIIAAPGAASGAGAGISSCCARTHCGRAAYNTCIRKRIYGNIC